MCVHQRAPSRLSRLQIMPTGTQSLSLSGFDHDVAITPDGSRVVYIGNNGTQLFVRALDALEPVALARGELRAPFISSDGQWVGLSNGTDDPESRDHGGPPATVFRSFTAASRSELEATTRSFSPRPDPGVDCSVSLLWAARQRS